MTFLFSKCSRTSKKLIIAIACFFISLPGLKQIIGLDIFLHIKTGQWIWDALSIPRVQLYSFILGQKEWINHQWLFQAIIYPIHSLSGLNGLIVLRYTIICILLYIFYKCIKKTYYTLPVSLLVMNISFMLGYERFFLIRPEIISILFTVLFIFSLRAYKGNSNILLLLPLQVIWVNTHGYFIIGPALACLYVISKYIELKFKLPFSWNENRIQSIFLNKILVLAVLLFLVSFMNPNFLKGAYYPFDIVNSTFGEYGANISSHISELKVITASSIFLTGEMFQLHILIFLLCLSFLMNVRNLHIFDIAVSSLLLLFNLAAMRNTGFFAFSAGILAVLNFLDSEYAFNKNQQKLYKNSFKIIAGFGILALLANYLVLVPAYAKDIMGRYIYDLKGNSKSYYFGLNKASLAYPEGAAYFIHDNNISGNIFNVFNNGAYLIFQLYPDCKVFIDGRTELYKGEFMFADMACLSDPETIANISREHDVACVVLPCDPDNLTTGMFDYLYKNRQWRLVFFDGHSSVFLKDIDSYRDLIKSNEIDLNSFKIEPDSALILQAIKGRYYPAAFLNAARFFVQIDMLPQAIRLLDYAGDMHSKDYDFYSLRGIISAKTGRLEEALCEFEKAAETDSQDAALFKNIGIIYIKLGQTDIAKKYFQEGLRVNPGNKALQACIENLDEALAGNS
jgi:tetratricopeptide (TPR) repeat protein